MVTSPEKGDPDLERYPKHDRFTDLPVVPKAEHRDWLPFRPVRDR